MADRAAALSLKAVTKSYDSAAAPVLDGIDLDISAGDLVTLLGPSGCGKSTLLRLVAGFISPDAGRIEIDGRDVARVPTHKRDIAIVHQSHALWPHLTVAENVSFGLEMRRVRGAERARIVAEMLETVGLDGFGRRMPAELSGGQQQRVALARALVVRPKVLLLDEPLSSLDANLRVHLREEIRRIQRDLGVTTVLVTHDREEAMAVSDRVVLLQGGRIAQSGGPEDLYRRPESAFVMGFTGAAVQLPGVVLKSDALAVVASSPLGEITALQRSLPVGAGADVVVAVRPDELSLLPLDPGGQRDHVVAVVESITFLGAGTDCRVRLPTGERIEVRVTDAAAARPLTVGGEVRVVFDPRSLHIFAA